MAQREVARINHEAIVRLEGVRLVVFVSLVALLLVFFKDVGEVREGIQ